MRLIVLDTETTGLEPEEGHRIIEIGCVEIRNRQVSADTLHLYLNPDRESDPEALKIHGLDSEFLANHPRFHEVAQQFIDFVRGAELIIHNAAFDVKFLDSELERIQLPPLSQSCARITDSLMHAREMFPGKRNSLDALCERFEISNAHRTLHGALLDAQLLAEVWLAMTRGQDSLLDAATSTNETLTAGMLADGFDPASLPMISIDASAQQAHEAYLDELDKAAGGTSLWRKLQAHHV